MESKPTETEFVKLINENQGLIHKVCMMYCHNEEYRKDLFQDIVLQLWRSFPAFKNGSKISTWMYRIALNTTISSFRKESKAPLLTDIAGVKIQIEDTNEAAEQKEQLSQLETAIKQLNEIDRAIVMLYFEDMPYEEIAETLGITQNNVRVKMNRIREKLKTILTAS